MVWVMGYGYEVSALAWGMGYGVWGMVQVWALGIYMGMGIGIGIGKSMGIGILTDRRSASAGAAGDSTSSPRSNASICWDLSRMMLRRVAPPTGGGLRGAAGLPKLPPLTLPSVREWRTLCES